MQSFPPVTVLKRLKSFDLVFEIPRFADCVNEETLRSRVKENLTQSEFKLLETGESVDGRLKCHISIMDSVKDGSGRPICFSYCVSSCVLTTSAGYSSSELFIVWSQLCHGVTDAAHLCARVETAVADHASMLVEQLIEVQK